MVHCFRLIPPLVLLTAALLSPGSAQADIHVSATGTVVTITGDNDLNAVRAVATRTGADIIVRNGESATADGIICQVQLFFSVRCALGGPATKMVATLPGPLADVFEKGVNAAVPELVWDLELSFGDSIEGRDAADLDAPGDNTVDGGPGADDTVRYRGCPCPDGVNVDLGGAAGGQTIKNVEILFGSGHDDHLVGRDGPVVANPTIDDVEAIFGGPGDDVIEGRKGADNLDGGEGASDVMLAADGERDAVSCGPDGGRAVVDATDSVQGCSPSDLGFDRDGDALLDEWEEHGYDADGNGTPEVDLPAMGANPDRKDVFVEIDFMTGHRLPTSTVALAVAAFADAPVPSLNGAPPGIALHVDNGPDSVMDPLTGEAWGARSNQNDFPHVDVLGTQDASERYSWAAFDQLRASGLLVDRRPIFHYVISAHRGPGTFVGISRGFESSDLLLTLGSADEAPHGQFYDGDTFMHELGHNLGLHHGGADDINNKPNYLSIMSYGHGGAGLIKTDGSQILDYSRFAIPLDENSLDETNGFGLSPGTPPTIYSTFYHCPDGTVSAAELSGPVDWTCDGNIFGPAGRAHVNVNGDNRETVLTGQTDWDKLVYDGGVLGNRDVPAATQIIEPTAEEIAAQDAAVGAAFAAAHPTAPAPPANLVPPPGDPTSTASTPLSPVAAPKLTALRVTPGRVRPARRGGSVVRRGGVKVSYRLDRVAAVVFTVERRSGRRWVRVPGSFKHAGKAGTNTLRFSGRLAGKRLASGLHRLVATPQGGIASRAQFSARR